MRAKPRVELLESLKVLEGSSSRRPVHDDQPRHTLEFPDIGGNERQSPAPRLRRNQDIVVADRDSEWLQMSANESRLASILCVEGQNDDLGTQKFLDAGDILRDTRAFRRAVPEFLQRRCRKGHRTTHQRFGEPLGDLWRFAVQGCDRNIGVDADHVSSAVSASSRMVPWSRPSSMNGMSRYRSSSASQAAASNGFLPSGSRMTLSPTLLTRTSLPANRNSFGRRTAWLRPCLNILPVAPMVSPLQMVDTIDIYHATRVSVNSSSSAGRRAPNSARARTTPPRAENSGASIKSSARISILTPR